jgi:hypothetical protein
VAWVPDLGKSCVERGLEQGSWIVGTQFEPCAELGLLVVRRVVGEFDAEMPAAGKLTMSIGWSMPGNSTVRTGLPMSVSKH